MKPVEIVLRSEERGWGRMIEGVNLRYILSTYANIKMYPSIQLLYTNKKFFKTKNSNKNYRWII
jgi:hypothetical protein